MSKPTKKTREKSKTRAWEKERRNRLNEYFNKLWEVLPIYDKSKPASKADVLLHATSTIKDLDDKLKKLLDSSGSDKPSEEKLKVSSDVIKKLRDRVRKLLLRNEQLANLLSNAGIKVPSECGPVKKFKKSLKYTNAISTELQATILQKELEKENQVKGARSKLTKTGPKSVRKSKRKGKKQVLSLPNCLLVVSQPSVASNSCFILSKPPAKMKQTVMVKTPIVSTDIKSSIFPTFPQLAGLGAGTLMFANGAVMPVVPTPRPDLPTIITNPIPSQLIIVSSGNNINSTLLKQPGNGLSVLRPRSNITMTTQVNKVPIPALSSKYNKHTCVNSKKIQVEDTRKKGRSAKKRTTEQIENEAKKVKSTVTSEMSSSNNRGDGNDKISKAGEKSAQLNQEKVCNETSTVVAEVPKTTTVNSAPVSSNSNFPIEPFEDNDTRKIVFTSATPIVNSVSETNVSIVAKPKQDIISTNGSKNVSNQSGHSETLANNPVKINTVSTVPNSKPLEMTPCAKQNLKVFDNSNLNDLKSLEMNISQTELSNDIFASFHVPSGCQNQESTSPTAAFLLAFPLVSSGVKVAEVMGDENSESQAGTPNLLQIGTMDLSKTTQSYSESLTPNLLSFENFSFFNNKENNCGGFYNNTACQSNGSSAKAGFPGNVNQSKSLAVGNKPNKVDLNVKNSTPNYHEKIVAPETVLDINADIFSFKPVSNESYLRNNNKNINGPVYTSKSDYNYKNCNNNYYPPVYTSAAISNTFYNSFNTEGDSRNYSNNYTDYNRKSFSNSCKNQTNQQPKDKPPFNWMTTPSTTASYKGSSDYFLPPSFNSNLSTLPSNTYFNNDHLNISQDFRKTSEMSLPTYTSYQRTETDENQFSWSPNKMPQFLDTSTHTPFVSSTLPTLVGDLALNNTPMVKDRTRDNRRKSGNCESQTSFLSVSQLVEPCQENTSAKVTSRRSSGNRSKTSTPKGKPKVNKDMQKANFNISVATNLFNDAKQQVRTNSSKHIASNYSAEALIGATESTPTKKTNSCQSKSVIPSFFNDNLVSYFPPTEDNNYMHASQSYQSNSFSQNFTTFQNNISYGTSNYISSSSYISSTTQDFLGENTNLFQTSSNNNAAASKDKCNFSKAYYRSPEKDDNKNQNYSCKKAKKRLPNDNVLPSFDIPFFSMPGAVNSPILPDDFHTTYLPPTTLYSCKNPLYPKQNSESLSGTLIPPLPKPTIQHPQMSPSVNSGGTSLTNFNLSTIFPEINKGTVQETFSNNRNNTVSKSISMSSSLQVPFTNKSSILF